MRTYYRTYYGPITGLTEFLAQLFLKYYTKETQFVSVMSQQNTSQPAGPSQPTAIRTNEVRSLPCFEPRAEPHTLSVRWKRWKRSFDLYVLAKGIVEDRQKVALLLHTAGQEVQDL